MIHFYYTYIRQSAHHALLSKYLSKFDLAFQRKILRFHRWQDAQLSLLGRVLLFDGLEPFNLSKDNIKIEYSKYCKPYLKDKGVEFNISHSGELVVCVISDQSSLGVDLELKKHIEIEAFKHLMTDSEWCAISSSSNELDAFYRYWTQKEALVKAIGKGFSLPLNSIEILDCKANIENEMYWVREVNIDQDYKCHLAFSKINDSLEIFMSDLKNY